jgi:hypothetical protein
MIMDYDEAYKQAVMWLKQNPGKGRTVISSANGFVVVDDDGEILAEFKISDSEEKDSN